QARPTDLRIVRVPLKLAGRARESGQPPITVRDRVPRVLRALVLQPGLFVAALVREVPVAAEVGVLVDPAQGGTRLMLQRADQGRVAGPAFVLVKQLHEEWSCVRVAVVRRVWTLFERAHLAVPHLVHDPAWVFVAEVVAANALPRCENLECGRSERRRER